MTISNQLKIAKVLLVLVAAITGYFLVESFVSRSLPEIDKAQTDLSLKAGFDEAVKAIALRDKIEASGRNFATDAIPEFETHLPQIENYYHVALKSHPKKLEIFNTIILKDMKAFFEKKQVTLGKWNGFHLLLNQLIDTKDAELSKHDWRTYSTYDFFDKFLCFVYAHDGRVGIQTYNYADANNIWVLPMATQTPLKMYEEIIGASDFTNAIPAYRGAFGAKVNEGKLAAIYAQIEKNTDLRERASGHLALYQLLRADTSSTYEYIDSAEDILRNAREQFQASTAQVVKDTVIDQIFSALSYADGMGQDIEIQRMDDEHYSIITSKRTFVATLTKDADKRILNYTDSKNKKIQVSLQAPFEPSSTNRIDRYSLELAKLLGFDSSADFRNQLAPTMDALIANHIKQ